MKRSPGSTFAITLFIVLLSGCGALVRQSEQRATHNLQSLSIGRSTPGDVASLYGPPQHEAVGAGAAGTVRVWSYYWTRMVTASADPKDRGAVDATLGLALGMEDVATGTRGRSAIIRFSFVNDVLVGIDRF